MSSDVDFIRKQVRILLNEAPSPRTTPAPTPPSPSVGVRRTKRGLSNRAKEMQGLAKLNPSSLMQRLGVRSKPTGKSGIEKCLNFLKLAINGNMSMPLAYENPVIQGNKIVIGVKGQESDDGGFLPYVGKSDCWRYISYAIGAASDPKAGIITEDDRPADVAPYETQDGGLNVVCEF